MDNDEFISFEAYGDDYTMKVYRREDCQYYVVLVYETDTESKVLYTSKSQPEISRARRLAMEHARKHIMSLRQES